MEKLFLTSLNLNHYYFVFLSHKINKIEYKIFYLVISTLVVLFLLLNNEKRLIK